MKTTTIVYRGEITFCNFKCSYCPFKTLFATCAPAPEELEKEKEGLTRLYTFLASEDTRRDSYTLFFAPRGEILTLECYRSNIARLSGLGGVKKIIIQTNFSFPLNWLDECSPGKIALWITYHPEHVEMIKFLAKLQQLSEKLSGYSVGMVGLKEYKKEARQLRCSLENSVYFWINAFKDINNYYTLEDIDFYSSIDPLFPLNLKSYESSGKACYAGEKVFTLDNRGRIKPCFFQESKLGILGKDKLEEILKPRLCPVETCSCYLGYTNLKEPVIEHYYSDLTSRIASPGVLKKVKVPLPVI